METVDISLSKLTFSQKLHLMECLWEDLTGNEDAVESPSWHENILKEREKGLETGEMSVSSWEEAKARIKRNVS